MRSAIFSAALIWLIFPPRRGSAQISDIPPGGETQSPRRSLTTRRYPSNAFCRLSVFADDVEMSEK
jgi:hypothetical protein